MRKLISTRYSEAAFNGAMLLLRLTIGVLMMHHGYGKLIHYSEYQKDFMNFLGTEVRFLYWWYSESFSVRCSSLSDCLQGSPPSP